MQIKLFLTSFILVSSALRAATIQIASDLVNEFNNRTAGNVFITPNPTWGTAPAGAGWISYADTGIGPESSHSDETAKSWTIFTENFFLPSTINTGSVRIWAYDDASFSLDGVTVVLSPDPAPQDRCAIGHPGCQSGVFGDISLAGLTEGAHTLTFSIYQSGNSPFGLLYSGSLDSGESTHSNPAAEVTTPEPGTLLLLGGGLIGLAAMIRRRRW